MEQTYATVIMLLLIIFVFVPMALMQNRNTEFEKLNNSFNLSVKVLKHNFAKETGNYEELARGTRGHNVSNMPDIVIDKEQMMKDFHSVMMDNFGRGKNYREVRGNMLAKVVSDHEKFFIADSVDNWEGPFYYTYTDVALLGKTYYLNTLFEQALDTDNNVVGLEEVFQNDDDVKNFPAVTTYESAEEYKRLLVRKRNFAITNKINRFIASKTGGLEEGLAIEFESTNLADASEGKRNTLKSEDFNPIEGISFFVVYKEENPVFLSTVGYNFAHKNVVGYTLR